MTCKVILMPNVFRIENLVPEFSFKRVLTPKCRMQLKLPISSVVCSERPRKGPGVLAMTLPSWALDYPVLEVRLSNTSLNCLVDVSCQERKFPSRYSGDYFRDTLPPDLYELEQAVVDGDVFTVRKLLQAPGHV